MTSHNVIVNGPSHTRVRRSIREKVSMVFAQDIHGHIGYNGTLPWNIAGDMEFFKTLTSGHIVIMGRKTYESIGKPLSERKNIIISSHSRDSFKNLNGHCYISNTISDAIAQAYQINLERPLKQRKMNIFFIGGASIYKQVLPLVDTVYRTTVNVDLIKLGADKTNLMSFRPKHFNTTFHCSNLIGKFTESCKVLSRPLIVNYTIELLSRNLPKT